MSVPAGGSSVRAYPPAVTSAWFNASAESPLGGVAGFLGPTLLHRRLQGRAFTGNARPEVLSSAILSPEY